MTDTIMTGTITMDAITTGIEINGIWRGGAFPHRQNLSLDR
jgi:hypothetical protein